MAKKMQNTFMRDVHSRKESQADIAEAIESGKAIAKRGRPRSAEPMETMTFRVSKENKRRLKVFASREMRQISDVLAELIGTLDIGE